MTESSALDRLLLWTSDKCRDALTRPDRMREILRRVAPEHDSLRVVKIAGTNGKGAVGAMLSACLHAADRRVGLYTSPHLSSPCERIRVDDRPIPADALERLAAQVEPALHRLAADRGPAFVPYFFEVMLAMAMRHFIDEGVRYVVVEAGIGGGRDATSLLHGPVSALTTVSFDHERLLGDTREAIAADKAMIASPGTTLVIGPGIDDDISRVVEQVVHPRGVRMVRASRDCMSVVARDHVSTTVHIAILGDIVECTPPLAGDHQIDNFATAAAVLAELSRVGDLSIREALRGVNATRWPGRFEFVPGRPDWLIDGAHNFEAVAALADGIERHFAGRRRILLFGASTEKRIDRYVPLLRRIADEVHVTDDFHRAESRVVVTQSLEGFVMRHSSAQSVWELADRFRRDPAINDSLIVVAGSLFLAGRVRETLGLPPS